MDDSSWKTVYGVRKTCLRYPRYSVSTTSLTTACVANCCSDSTAVSAASSVERMAYSSSGDIAGLMPLGDEPALVEVDGVEVDAEAAEAAAEAAAAERTREKNEEAG